MLEKDRSKEGELIEYRGKLHLYSATGTEGSLLAFYDRGIDPKKPKDDNWYRFHYIKDGDGLVIYDKEDPGKIVWQGQISLRDTDGTKLEYGDMWKYKSQQGTTIDEFDHWFSNEYPAKLTTKVEKKTPKPKSMPIKRDWEKNASFNYMVEHLEYITEVADVKNDRPVNNREFAVKWLNRIKERWGEQDIRSIDPYDYDWEYRKFLDEKIKKTEI